MNPFEAPPSTPVVSFEPPVDPPAPRRGRTVAIVVGTAGVITAGIVGVSALASADDPELTAVTDGEPAAVEVIAATEDEPGDDASDEPADDDGEPGDDTSDAPVDESGELRIQVGDDDPIVIDLGDLGDLGGLGDGSWGELQECLGLPVFGDLDLEGGTGELGDLGPLIDEFLGGLPVFSDEMLDGWFDDEQLQAWLDELETTDWGDGEWLGDVDLGGFDFGDQVTIVGDDGLTVIDLGDGDATVTIERDGDTGELTVTTDGTAVEQELGEWFEDVELPELPELSEGDWMLDGPLFDRLEECGLALDP